jgi:hypothetical protein
MMKTFYRNHSEGINALLMFIVSNVIAGWFFIDVLPATTDHGMACNASHENMEDWLQYATEPKIAEWLNRCAESSTYWLVLTNKGKESKVIDQ